MGYANRVVTIPFPELSDDPEDRIWVTMRNPKLVPVDEMRAARNITLDAGGEPADSDSTMGAAYGVLSRLIVGWHVYDATVIPQLNAAGEDVSEQRLLPQAPGITPAVVAKLPMEILNRLSEELKSVNPRMTPASQEATGSPS
jgi:hypothetical protein